MPKRYWLMKSEPEAFSWDDLLASKDQTTSWDGVRNYQARNLLRDEIKKGDQVFFYHSRVNPQVIMGTATVVREGYPDDSQFDPKSKYHDEKSDPENPRWFMVDIKADKPFKHPVSLPRMKTTPGLEEMSLLRKGNRLSVQPVTAEEWKIVRALSRTKGSE